MKSEHWIVQGGVAHRLATPLTAAVKIAVCGRSEWGRAKVTNSRRSKMCEQCRQGRPAKPTLAGVEPVEERQLAFSGEWAKLQGDP